ADPPAARVRRVWLPQRPRSCRARRRGWDQRDSTARRARAGRRPWRLFPRVGSRSRLPLQQTSPFLPSVSGTLTEGGSGLIPRRATRRSGAVELAQRIYKLRIVAPALYRAAVQRLPDLPRAGRDHGTRVVFKFQAARIPLETEELQQPARAALLLSYQLLVRN